MILVVESVKENALAMPLRTSNPIKKRIKQPVLGGELLLENHILTEHYLATSI